MIKAIGCRALATAIFASAISGSVWAAGDAAPYDSETWQDVLDLEFEGADVVYDDSLYLVVPEQVEEAFSVPVVMNFTETPFDIAEIALIAENNPFPMVARVYPQRPMNAIGFNIRLEMSTPVRAAVMDRDGVWHVVSEEVRVMTPGGCSAAGGGMMADAGGISTRQFVRADGDSRLKVRITHPMHTGLVVDAYGDAIPEHYIKNITIRDDRGDLAKMLLWASVSADPVFMFELPDTQQSVRIDAEDTSGGLFEFEGQPSSM
jgi:sulfur-oxidizing protein SoxY